MFGAQMSRETSTHTRSGRRPPQLWNPPSRRWRRTEDLLMKVCVRHEVLASFAQGNDLARSSRVNWFVDQLVTPSRHRDHLTTAIKQLHFCRGRRRGFCRLGVTAILRTNDTAKNEPSPFLRERMPRLSCRTPNLHEGSSVRAIVCRWIPQLSGRLLNAVGGSLT